MALNCHFAPTPKKLSYTRSGSIAVVSVTALAGVSGFVRNAFGENVLSRANEAAMLDIEAIEDQDCFIPHVTLSAFINATARHSGEETLGLLLALICPSPARDVGGNTSFRPPRSAPPSSAASPRSAFTVPATVGRSSTTTE
jgi:hypothetical protein